MMEYLGNNYKMIMEYLGNNYKMGNTDGIFG